MADLTEKIVQTEEQIQERNAATAGHHETHLAAPGSATKLATESSRSDSDVEADTEAQDAEKVKTHEDTHKGDLVRRVTTEGEDYLPPGPKLYLIVFSLMLCVFCVALDNTILAVAIPRITDEFHSLNDVGWYISAYLLTSCGKSKIGIAFWLANNSQHSNCSLERSIHYLVSNGFTWLVCSFSK